MKVICGYAGSKSKFADDIARIILRQAPERVYDLCCGTGSVSMALVDAGFDPKRITMVDAGPWGWFWHQIGTRTFDMPALRQIMRAMPSDPKLVAAWVEDEVAALPPSAVTFLVLQAAAYGSVSVWRDGEVWRRGDGSRGYSARKFWTPPAGSREKNPRGTIFRADEIIPRVEEIQIRMFGVNGICVDVGNMPLDDRDSVCVYCDPQYADANGYGYAVDWQRVLVGKLRHAVVLVSEHHALDGADQATKVYSRKGAGLRGISTKPKAEEWVSTWRGDLR